MSNSTPQDSWSRTDTSNTDTSNEDDQDTETTNTTTATRTIENRTEVEPDVISEDDSDTESPSSEAVADVEPEDTEITVETTADEYIELCVMQVNYSVREVAHGVERAIIHLFCRDPSDEHDKSIRVDVHNFKPYFYTTPRDAKQIDVKKDERFYNIKHGDDEWGSYESIRGKDLCRVEAHIPRVVGSIRDDFEHYEADVLFPDRFLIDKGIKSGVRVPKDIEDGVIEVGADDVEPADVSVRPRVHTVDIEVDDRNGFPEAEDAEEKILCITGHDMRFEDEYVIWYLDSDEVTADIPSSVDDYEFITEERAGDGEEVTRPEVDVRTFDSEDALLSDYIGYLDNHDVDVITGWNVDDFDATYLINRMEKLDERDEVERDIRPDRLSRINEVWSGGWRGPNIKGRVTFDLLEAYKRTQFSELVSYRLEYVGQKELGIGKERFDGDIGDLWENDPEQLIEYNLRDVEICVEIDKKQGIIDFWNETRQYVGCRLQDAPIPGDAVDVYTLQKTNGRFVLPSKGEVESGEDYEGGAVFEPITGVEEMVTVLDLKSLYPMSMTTINASPDTKIMNPEAYDGETYVAPNGIHYEKENDGIIREMVTELLEEREKKKELRSEYDPDEDLYKKYDMQQASVKVIMNSLYGVTGWDRFRLYDKDGAAAVTATGRKVIEFTEQVVNELGYEVKYGDTDSVMISLGDTSNEDVELSEEVQKRDDLTSEEKQRLQVAMNRSFEIEEHINEAYNDFAKEEFNAEENNFEIEFEKLYRRFLQAGRKKRYAGNIIWKEGSHVDDIDITGFEYQRSDIAGITKESQKQLIEMLVRGRDIEDVREYLENLITRFQDGEIPVSEIGIPGGIGKDLDNYETETAHVRGAKYANLLLDTNFAQGSKPKRVYLSRVDPSFYEETDLHPHDNQLYAQFKRDPDVICFIHDDQVPEAFEVDYDKMMNKILEGPLSRVLKATDLTWEDVKSGNTQSGLGQFMS